MSRQIETDLIQHLLESRRFALTTLSRDDYNAAHTIQTAIVRGDNDLLHWGVGPELERGDIVALYTPNSKYLPNRERSVLQRLYSVAARTAPSHTWKNTALLYRCITIDPPIKFKDLQNGIGLRGMDIMTAGLKTKPWSKERAESFWKFLFQERPQIVDRVSKRFLKSIQADNVAISYSGENWVQAQRLMLWCEEANLNTFFVTTVDLIETKLLKELLYQAFANTQVAVFLVSSKSDHSDWIKLEQEAALANAENILLVRTNSDCPWPSLSRKGVHRVELKPAHEEDFIKKVRTLLRGTAS